MRTPLLVVSLGMSLLAACEVGDVGGGGGDDTVGGAICGDNVKEGSEACDDGNTAAGDGCSATCQVEAVPRLDVSVDRANINTELKTTHMLTVTLMAGGGFSGAVNLTGTVVDNTGTALPTWTVAFDNATPNVTDGGSVTAVATLTIPSENKGLLATVKIDAATATTTTGTKSVSSTVTALNQVTVDMTLNGNGNCVYPTAGTLKVTTGSKIRFFNKTAADNITIHMGRANQIDPNTNLQHQPDPGSAPNTAYEQTVTGPVGGKTSWYCHAPGPTVNNLIIEAAAP